MNKRFLIPVVFCMLLASTAFGQATVKNYLTHKVIVNHADHTVITFVKPVKNTTVKSDKLYYWFSANQINATQGGYSGKLLNGSFQDFYLSKDLKESGHFNAGLKTGKWKGWNETGSLKEEFTWSAGKRNGIYSKYDSLGRISESGKYRNDLLNGKQRVFTGDSSTVILYKKGKVTERKPVMPKFVKNLFSKKNKTK